MTKNRTTYVAAALSLGVLTSGRDGRVLSRSYCSTLLSAMRSSGVAMDDIKPDPVDLATIVGKVVSNSAAVEAKREAMRLLNLLRDKEALWNMSRADCVLEKEDVASLRLILRGYVGAMDLIQSVLG